MTDKLYNVINGPNGKFIRAWIRHVPVEEAAIQQLFDVLQLPFVGPYVCAMPDIHFGMGSTIGSVIPCDGAIIPAAVGVDVCCGMSVMKLDLSREDFDGKEEAIRAYLKNKIPNGRTNNGGTGDRGAWANIPDDVCAAWNDNLAMGFDQMDSIKDLITNRTNSRNHLGTLGTGNHFLSLSTDEKGGIWLVVHSGSRGIGARIGNYFIGVAQELCDKWRIPLPNKDLAYLPEDTQEFDDYMYCMDWCNRFATTSRGLMLAHAKECLDTMLGKSVTVTQDFSCHHNFVSKETFFGKSLNIIRKGAVRARAGEFAIIPGAMGKKSFIVEGKGSEESLNSCSHGAGRLMSRTKAKGTITLEEHVADMEGVFCDKDASVIDESPKAYKNVDDVMKSQTDLVTPLFTLQEFINIKGTDPDKKKKFRTETT